MAQDDVALRATLDLRQFNQAINQYTSGINRIVGETTRMTDSLSRVGSAANSGIGVAIGVTAANAIQSFSSGIVKLGGNILDTLKFFESLQFSIETTIALTLQLSDSNLSTAESFELAATEAQSYLLFLQDLAIFSPFTTAEVGAANRTLQIYGLLSDEAAGLTRLIVDLASVGGFGAERLQRIALATGQIFAEGRLLARDALQLTQAGVPILNFITEMTGQTTGELQQMMRQGVLPASLAFEALVKGLEKFEGAGRRVAGTAQGLTSSIADIAETTSFFLSRGIFEGFRPFLQGIVDATATDEFRAAATAIGDALGEGVTAALADVSDALTAFLKLIKVVPREVTYFGAAFFGSIAILTAFAGALGVIQLLLGALINPFTLVIAAFASFLSLYVAGQERIANASNTAARTVVNFLSQTVKSFTLFEKTPIGSIKAVNDFSTAFGKAGVIVVNAMEAITRAADTASSYITSLLSTLYDWGQAAISIFSSGLEAGASAVTGALQVIGAVMGGLLAPGSPPRLLPDLDKWGTQAAEVWLKGWLEADFDILGDISSSVQKLLRASVSAGDLDEVSAVRILIGSRKEIARAIDDINQTGRVTTDTMRKVRRAVGPAADQVESLLHAYERVAKATKIAAEAQEKLDAVTESYEKQLEPLRKELERIKGLLDTSDANLEILHFQRIIANEATSQARKRNAQLNIQRILLEGQVDTLETQQKSEEETAKKAVDAADKERDAAELQLRLAEQRIAVQTQQIELYGEEIKAIENLARELERLRKKWRDEFFKPFEDAIKKVQLLAAEVSDTIELFRAQYDLTSAEATEAEKVAAAIAKQGVEARRAKRFLELRELGVSPEEIKNLRTFVVTLADIGKEAANTDETDLSDLAESFSGRIEEFNKKVAAFREEMEKARKEFVIWKEDISNFLPPYLSLIDTTGEGVPLFNNLKAAFLGFATILVSNRIVEVLSALPGLILGVGNPLGFVSNLLGVFTAAWIGNWFDIRNRTNIAVEEIKRIITGVGTGEIGTGLFPTSDEMDKALESVRSTWGFFIKYIQSSISEGFSVDEFKNSLTFFEVAVKTTVDALSNIQLFSDIQDQLDEFVRVISDPKALSDGFNAFYTNLRQGFANSVTVLSQDPNLAETITGYLVRSIVQAAAAFIQNAPVLTYNFLQGINKFLIGIRPTLPTLFDDLFGRLVPILNYSFGRMVAIVGSGIKDLLTTLIAIVFQDLVPSIIRNFPVIIGAFLVGFQNGLREIGADVEEAINFYKTLVIGFFTVKFGPSVASAVTSVMQRAFSIGSGAIFISARQFVTNITKGFSLIIPAVVRILGALVKDITPIANRIVIAALKPIEAVANAILGPLVSKPVDILFAAFVKILTILDKILQVIVDFFTPFVVWPKVLQKVTGAFSSLGAGLVSFGKALKSPLQFVGQLADALIRGILGVMPRVSAILTRVSGVFINIASVVGSFSTNLINIGKGFVSFVRTLVSGSSAATSAIVKFAGGIGTFIVNLIRGFDDVSNLRGIINGVTSTITKFYELVRSGPLGIIESIIRGIAVAGSTFFKALFSSISAGGSVATKTVELLRSGFSGLFAVMSNLVKTDLVGLIGKGLLKLSKIGLKPIDEIGKLLNSMFQGVGPEQAKAITRSLTDLFVGPQGIEGIGSFFKKAGTGIGGVFDSIKDLSFVKAIFSLKNLGNILKGVGALIRGTFLTPIGLITSAIDFLGFAWNHEIEGVSNGAKELASNFKRFLGDLISGELWRQVVEGATYWFGQLTGLYELITEFGFDSPIVQQRLGVFRDVILTFIIATGRRIWASITQFWVPTFVDWIGYTAQNIVRGLGIIVSTVTDWIEAGAGWIGTKLRDEWIPAFLTWWSKGGGQQQFYTTLTNISDTIIGWVSAAAGWLVEKLALWVPAFLSWTFDVTPKILGFLGQMAIDLIAWIISKIPDMTAALLTWAAAFIDWLGPVVGSTIVKLGEWLAAIIKWVITDGIPGIVKGVAGMIGALISWISGDKESAEAKVPEAFGKFLKAIGDFFAQDIFPALFTAGKGIVTAIWTGFQELWDEILKTEWGPKLKEAVLWPIDVVNAFKDGGIALMAFIVDSMLSAFGTSINDITTKMLDLNSAIQEGNFKEKFFTAASDIGRNIALGIAFGIIQFMPEPLQQLVGLTAGIIAETQKSIDARSPSQVTAELIGRPMAEGIALGIQSVSQEEATGSLADNIIKGLQAVVESAVQQFDDLQDKAVKSLDGMAAVVGRSMLDVGDAVVGSSENLSKDSLKYIETFSADTDTSISVMADNSGGYVANLVDLITVRFQRMNTDVTFAMIAMRSAVIAEFEKMGTESQKAVDAAVENIIKAFITGEGSLVKQIRAAFIGDTTNRKGTVSYALGYDFVLGIAAGISSTESYNALFAAFKGIIDKVIEAIKMEYGVDSPSDVTADLIGEPLAQGVVVGIERMLPTIRSTLFGISSMFGVAGQFSTAFAPSPRYSTPGITRNDSRTYEYNLNVTSSTSSQGIVSDFAILRALAQ